MDNVRGHDGISGVSGVGMVVVLCAGHNKWGRLAADARHKNSWRVLARVNTYYRAPPPSQRKHL